MTSLSSIAVLMFPSSKSSPAIKLFTVVINLAGAQWSIPRFKSETIQILNCCFFNFNNEIFHQVRFYLFNLLILLIVFINLPSSDFQIVLLRKTWLKSTGKINKINHQNTFVQLGFSSNITSDKVALTNFVKSFNFCGRLFFDSLVAQPFSVQSLELPTRSPVAPK